MSNLRTLSIIIAPFTEEVAKRAALNISRKSGYKYTAVFASAEFFMYMGYLPIVDDAEGFILARLGLIFLHLFFTGIQDMTERSTGLKYVGLFLAMIFHGTWNLIQMNKVSHLRKIKYNIDKMLLKYESN